MPPLVPFNTYNPLLAVAHANSLVNALEDEPLDDEPLEDEQIPLPLPIYLQFAFPSLGRVCT